MPPPDPPADEATDVLVEHTDLHFDTKSPKGTAGKVTRVWNVFAQDDLVGVFPEEDEAVNFAI